MTEIPESGHAPAPKWLIFFSIALVLSSLVWYVIDFNGTSAILDPGSWKALQQAANTTFVHE